MNVDTLCPKGGISFGLLLNRTEISVYCLMAVDYIIQIGPIFRWLSRGLASEQIARRL